MKKKIIFENMESAYNEEAVKAFCAAKIKKVRLGLNLSQDEMAHFIGMSLSSYKKYELGTLLPPVEFLWKLSELVDEPIDYFVRETNDEERCWAYLVTAGSPVMFKMLSRLVAYFGIDKFQKLVDSIFEEDGC